MYALQARKYIVALRPDIAIEVRWYRRTMTSQGIRGPMSKSSSQQRNQTLEG